MWRMTMMASYNSMVFIVVCFITIHHVVQVRGACDVMSVGRVYGYCASKYPTMSTVVRGKSRFSGKDMVEIFNHFCAAIDPIHKCVEERLAKDNCLDSESATAQLHEDYEVTEYYCDGNKLIADISTILVDLPSVSFNPAGNDCLTTAVHRREVCSIEIALALALEGKSTMREKRDGLVDSMLCTYRSFGTEACPLDAGFVTTVALYAEMVVPPLYGVNMTQPLINMVHYYTNHGETE